MVKKIKINYLNIKKIGGSTFFSNNANNPPSQSQKDTSDDMIIDLTPDDMVIDLTPDDMVIDLTSEDKKDLNSNPMVIDLTSISNEEEKIYEELEVIEQTLEDEENYKKKTQNEKDEDNKFIKELTKSIVSIINIIKNKEGIEKIAEIKLIYVLLYLKNKEYTELEYNYVPAIKIILSSLYKMYTNETKLDFENFIINVLTLSDIGLSDIEFEPGDYGISNERQFLMFIKKDILNSSEKKFTNTLDDNYIILKAI